MIKSIVVVKIPCKIHFYKEIIIKSFVFLAFLDRCLVTDNLASTLFYSQAVFV